MGLFSGRSKLIRSSDLRAMFAGYCRHPNGSLGGEIRTGDTRPKVIVGSNSAANLPVGCVRSPA
jgi:hypothetical protein